MDTVDTVETYRQIIQQVLTEYAQIPFAYGDIEAQTVFDCQSDRYLLMLVGRDGKRRIHGCLIHVAIINDKIWIQRDGTEVGIANELVSRGIPKDQIVLAFYSPEHRQHTEFAVA